jgi:hypothetical protein
MSEAELIVLKKGASTSMKKWYVLAAAAMIGLTVLRFSPDESSASAPVEPSPAASTAYIDHVAKENNSYVLSIDTIDWYEGEDAVQPFLEREGDSGLDGPPDGYYIVNDETELTKLPIASDAEVLMQIYNRTGNVLEVDIVWNESISLDTFIGLLEANDEALDVKNFPYHLTVRDGQIVKIVQQFIP